MGHNIFYGAVFLQQYRGGLGTDSRHSGDIIGSISLQA